MNFTQLAMLEYVLDLCASLLSNANGYELVLESNDDIFTANSITYGTNKVPLFHVRDNQHIGGYREIPVYQLKSNPLGKAHTSVFNEFFGNDGDMVRTLNAFLTHPYAFIDDLVRFIASIDIKYEFNPREVVFDYQSLKYPNVKLPWKDVSSQEFNVISLKFF